MKHDARNPRPILLDREAFTSATTYTGAILKRAREARGLTLDQVCERTRVPKQHLVHLEADRYDRLPPAVYLRGFLLALAKELRLDGHQVARSYMEAIAAAAKSKSR